MRQRGERRGALTLSTPIARLFSLKFFKMNASYTQPLLPEMGPGLILSEVEGREASLRAAPRPGGRLEALLP